MLIISRLEEHYARLEKEWRGSDHQVIAKEIYSNITKYSADTAGRTFAGDILFEYVPQMERFEQKPMLHENELEFAPVFQFLFQVFELDDVRRLVEEYFEN